MPVQPVAGSDYYRHYYCQRIERFGNSVYAWYLSKKLLDLGVTWWGSSMNWPEKRPVVPRSVYSSIRDFLNFSPAKNSEFKQLEITIYI